VVKKSVAQSTSLVTADELGPGHAALAFASGAQSMQLEDIADGLVGDDQSEIGQRPGDAVVTPCGVLSGQLHNPLLDLSRDGWTARLSSAVGREIPLLGDQFAVPFEECFGLNNGDDFRKPLAERLALFGQRDALGVGQSPMRRVPIQQGAVDAVFLQDKLEFLAQGLVDLCGGPCQQLFPRHGERINSANALKQRQNDGNKMRRINYLTTRDYIRRQETTDGGKAWPRGGMRFALAAGFPYSIIN
jgi:hypothetical protein